MTTRVFHADLDRFGRAFAAAGAVRAEADGFQWIDETKVPAALVNAYRLLLQYGYANGLI